MWQHASTLEPTQHAGREPMHSTQAAHSAYRRIGGPPESPYGGIEESTGRHVSGRRDNINVPPMPQQWYPNSAGRTIIVPNASRDAQRNSPLSVEQISDSEPEEISGVETRTYKMPHIRGYEDDRQIGASSASRPNPNRNVHRHHHSSDRHRRHRSNEERTRDHSRSDHRAESSHHNDRRPRG